jgi:hypothetical protein
VNGNHYIINLPNVQGQLKSYFKCVETFKVTKAFKTLNDRRQKYYTWKNDLPMCSMKNLAKSNHFKLNIHLSKQQFSSYLTFWKILLTYIVARIEKKESVSGWLISYSFVYCFKIESKFQNIRLLKQNFSWYLMLQVLKKKRV